MIASNILFSSLILAILTGLTGCVGTASHDLIVINYRSAPVDVKIEKTTYPTETLQPDSHSYRSGAVTTNVIRVFDSRTKKEILVIDSRNRRKYLHGREAMIVEVR